MTHVEHVKERKKRCVRKFFYFPLGMNGRGFTIKESGKKNGAIIPNL